MTAVTQLSPEKIAREIVLDFGIDLQALLIAGTLPKERVIFNNTDHRLYNVLSLYVDGLLEAIDITPWIRDHFMELNSINVANEPGRAQIYSNSLAHASDEAISEALQQSRGTLTDLVRTYEQARRGF